MWLDTFNQMRKDSRMSLDELCAKSGVPKGTLTKITSGVTKAPALETIRSLVYAMGYTLDDLEQGLNTSGTFSKAEREHIKKYRTLDKRGKDAVDSVLELEYRWCEEARSTPAPKTPRMVEKLIYVNPAAAGTPLYAESDFERMEFPEDDVPAGADFGIRISGRSMEPDISDGDIVWVHKTADFEDGEVGVFMLNDSSTCKRYFKNADGTVRLESDNPEFGPVPLSEFDSFVPVGRVVGKVVT